MVGCAVVGLAVVGMARARVALAFSPIRRSYKVIDQENAATVGKQNMVNSTDFWVGVGMCSVSSVAALSPV